MDKRNVRYIMFVVFLLLGIIVAIQFRSIMDERAAGRLDTTNEIQKLIEIIDAEKSHSRPGKAVGSRAPAGGGT